MSHVLQFMFTNWNSRRLNFTGDLSEFYLFLNFFIDKQLGKTHLQCSETEGIESALSAEFMWIKQQLIE